MRQKGEIRMLKKSARKHILHMLAGFLFAGELRNSVNFVIARSKATWQSRNFQGIHGIASLRSQ